MPPDEELTVPEEFEDDRMPEEGTRLRQLAADAGEETLPCGRAHLPATVCILPEDHPESDARRGWTHEFEEVEGPEVSIDESALAGGFTVRSGTFPFPGEDRHYPVLIFDYVGANGARFRPIALVMDESDLENVGRLVATAGHSAVHAARVADGRDPKTGR